jgi:hypothetical protein
MPRRRNHGAPKPLGRPPRVFGFPVNVYLTAQALAIASTLGNGNISDGIRRALLKAAAPQP